MCKLCYLCRSIRSRRNLQLAAILTQRSCHLYECLPLSSIGWSWRFGLVPRRFLSLHEARQACPKRISKLQSLFMVRLEGKEHVLQVRNWLAFDWCVHFLDRTTARIRTVRVAMKTVGCYNLDAFECHSHDVAHLTSIIHVLCCLKPVQSFVWAAACRSKG